jgi:hypothetical protein
MPAAARSAPLDDQNYLCWGEEVARTPALPHIQRNRMHPGVEVPQSLMHRPVAGDAGHGLEGLGADQDVEMAGPRAVIPGMARVAVAFVGHLQPVGRKGGAKARLDISLHRHFTITLFYPPGKHLNSQPRVGKAHP